MARPKKQEKLWRVLVAEDDLKYRAQLLKILRPLAQCVSVENGEQALMAYQKAIREKEPLDFVLLDVTMPLLDGFSVLKTIRANEETRNIPFFQHTRIFMITAYKDSLMEMYNMGWDEYITKPIDTEKLIAKMKKMMES